MDAQTYKETFSPVFAEIDQSLDDGRLDRWQAEELFDHSIDVANGTSANHVQDRYQRMLRENSERVGGYAAGYKAMLTHPNFANEDPTFIKSIVHQMSAFPEQTAKQFPEEVVNSTSREDLFRRLFTHYSKALMSQTGAISSSVCRARRTEQQQRTAARGAAMLGVDVRDLVKAPEGSRSRGELMSLMRRM